jgi:DNA invertase Pin-like site-specific DNA recombinase
MATLTLPIETRTAKKVVLYARTSTSDQTTDNQTMALRDYCDRMNYNVVDEYIDNGFSGKNDNRPEFERLLADVRRGQVKAIIVYKLDRIGRSLKHLLNLFEEFRNLNIEFISLTQNINTATPEGKMFWQMLGVFAEYERELIVARTNAGLDRARRQGKVLGRPVGAKDTKRRRLSGYYNRWVNNPPRTTTRKRVKNLKIETQEKNK